MPRTLVRTSERTCFKRCRQQHDWAFTQRLKPKTEAPPLRFGTLVHKSMEAFYRPGLKRGPRPATTFLKLYAAELKQQRTFGFKDADGKWAEAGDLGEVMLTRYYDLYGKDDRYEVIATEQPFQVAVRDGSGKVRFTYVGVIDGIWRDRDNGYIYVVDHKTTASDPTKTDYLALDEQAGAYWTFGVDWLRMRGILDPKLPLAGMLYNFLRKAVPDLEKTYDAEGRVLNKPKKADLVAYATRPGVKGRGLVEAAAKKMTVDELIDRIGPSALQLGEVSKQQPPPFFHRELVYRDEHDRYMVRQRALDEAYEIKQVQRGHMAVYKNPGRFTCSMCGFRAMCQLHEIGADWEALKNSTMTTWEPYAEHEVYEGERN